MLAALEVAECSSEFLIILSSLSLFFVRSTDARGFYDSSDLKSILVDGQLISSGTYSEITSSECRSQSTGAVTFEVANDCSSILRIIEQTGNCFWVPFCVYQRFRSNVEAGTPLRQVYLKDERIMKCYNFEAQNKITTSIVDGDELSGYFGTFTWDDIGKGKCTIGYQFSIPRNGLSGKYIMDEFKKSIPTLKTMFSRHERFVSFGRRLDKKVKLQIEERLQLPMPVRPEL